jgi:hypothetical protein
MLLGILATVTTAVLIAAVVAVAMAVTSNDDEH